MGAGIALRDRVKELRRVPVAELLADPRNWRRHPARQGRLVRQSLKDFGIVDALLARQQADGRLVLLDGHLRRDLLAGQEDVPVLLLDVTEEEAGRLLLLLDPLAGLAKGDTEAFRSLVAAGGDWATKLKPFLGQIDPGRFLRDSTAVKTCCSAASARPGVMCVRRWTKQSGKSDDYASFLAWKAAPSLHEPYTRMMAAELAGLIDAAMGSWRGYAITEPPPGASRDREYPAGFLGVAVAEALGVEHLTVFEATSTGKRHHHPRESQRKTAIKVAIEPPGPLVIVDDMVTSGTTGRRCLEALRGKPAWFFAWSLNWGRT